jgi:hypothetical protein
MRFALLLILVLISFSLISNTDAGPSNPSKGNGYHWIGRRFLNKKRLSVKQIFK